MKTYPIDRLEPPLEFYTPKNLKNSHKVKPGVVLTKSGDHPTADWVCVGYVSKQTPFGQGIFKGFPIKDLRLATPREVRNALRTNHPRGWWFRPSCIEALDAETHLEFSYAIDNWTNESYGNGDSVLRISRKQIIQFGEEALRKHRLIMLDWGNITANQRKSILAKFKETEIRN